MAISGMGVRRHLTALAAEGLVEPSACTQSGPGRPPTGWRLSAAGRELFPRRYDALAIDLIDDLAPEELAGALAYLVSREADYVTGQHLEVAGGWAL
jgi:predicted ArsR family transcriptional regulator